MTPAALAVLQDHLQEAGLTEAQARTAVLLVGTPQALEAVAKLLQPWAHGRDTPGREQAVDDIRWALDKGPPQGGGRAAWLEADHALALHWHLEADHWRWPRHPARVTLKTQAAGPIEEGDAVLIRGALLRPATPPAPAAPAPTAAPSSPRRRR